MFFEASANTKLNEAYTGDESVGSDEPLQEKDAADAGEQSLSFEREQSNVSSDDGTPRPSRAEHKWSDDMSPFEALKADLDRFGIPSTAQSNSSLVSQTARELLHARGPPLDSPELSLSRFETLGDLDRFNLDKGKQRAFDIALDSPQPRLKVGADKHHPDLLKKILRKNFESPLPPGSSTPGKGARTKVAIPETIPKGWDGIADLSTTPMSAFSFSSRHEPNTGDISPPPSQLSFDLGDAPFSQTPGKRPIHGLHEYDYTSVPSPLPSPPSIIKNWDRSAYAHPPSPSPSKSRQNTIEDEDFVEDDGCEEDEDAPAFEMPLVKETLAEFGGGTTARIEDLLNEDSFAKVVDEDAGAGSDEDPGLAMYEGDYGGEEDESYLDGNNYADRRFEAPEDTLFGMPQRPVDDHSDSFIRQESEFRVLGLDEMHTLHGGNILESEPFDASPLAGRRHR